MRVGFDGYYLAKPRGLGRYLQELLYALGRYATPEFEFFVAVPETVSVEHYVMPERIRYIVVKDAPFPIWEQWRIPKVFCRLELDVTHFPYNTRPLLSRGMRSRKVVTVHDMIFMDPSQGKGGSWYQKFGNVYRKEVVSRFHYGQQLIVTDSHSSAKSIESHLGLSSTVVYIPTEYAFRNLTNNPAPPCSMEGVRYFLHVGGTSPHKNTERCIQAFLSSSQEDSVLVVLGLSENSSLAMQYGGRKVIFPGWVSDNCLASYYSHAVAILFPSLIEGYGLPVVEGFTLGIPVITSDLDPMNEIAGGAALHVDPYSIESISDAICLVGNDTRVVEELKLAGNKRLERINGKIMAAEMVDIYLGKEPCKDGL